MCSERYQYGPKILNIVSHSPPPSQWIIRTVVWASLHWQSESTSGRIRKAALSIPDIFFGVDGCMIWEQFDQQSAHQADNCFEHSILWLTQVDNFYKFKSDLCILFCFVGLRLYWSTIFCRHGTGILHRTQSAGVSQKVRQHLWMT